MSTLPEAKAALVALLETAFAATDVVVSYGHPGAEIEERHVWVGDMDDETDQEWSSIGTARREEEYALRVVCVSALPGATQQESTEDAYATFAVVESTLRANPRLGQPAVVRVAQVKRPRLEEYVNQEGQGFAAAVASAVRCNARI